MKKHTKIKSRLLSIFLVLSIVCYSFIPFNNKLSITEGDQRFITPKVAETTPYIAWVVNGTPISTANDIQTSPDIISDGAGGVIIVWGDTRNSITTDTDVYAQRIDSSGDVQWIGNGTPISSANDKQGSTDIISDGAGGAIIVWDDRRNRGYTEFDIFAQRINSTGTVQWTTNGIPICTANDFQTLPQLTSDGAGGAIIIWMDDRDIEGIYAQRINSSGHIQWALDGIPITTTPISMIPQIIGDGAGGAIVTWQDFRISATDGDIYAQKINSSGDVQWTINGVAISTANDHQRYPQLTSDGSGGAIIAWEDDRIPIKIATTNVDIYAQRINSSGVVQWTTNGIPICTSDYSQRSPQLTGDGSGGAIIAWTDSRNYATTRVDIYAQKINSFGEVQWVTNGTAVSTAAERQEIPRLVSDSLGGAFIGWMDSRNSGGQTIYDIYIQKLTSTGLPQWIENGIPICTKDNMQQLPQLISDGPEQVIVVWEDHRVSGYQNADIYAQKVIYNTIPTSNHPDFINTTTTESESIGWILTDIGAGGNYRVLIGSTVYQDWQSWIRDTLLNISIDHSVAGTFVYTIEYYDTYNMYGVPDSVNVFILNTSASPEDITESSSEDDPSISFGYSFIFPMLFGILLITYVARRKYVLQKNPNKNG